MTYPQFAEPSSLDTGYTQTDEIFDTLTKQFALLTQSFRATLPQTNNQLRTSSNTRNLSNYSGRSDRGSEFQGQQNQNQRYFVLGKMVQQVLEVHRIELGMLMQADECDAFDSNVDDEPTSQSIFMANLSSAGPTNLQASSSDASILSEVPDLENANVASDND
ncbi:hypothetical protein Tco_1032319 [Tanacetum coccineum]|uniref:Uncharacterized protein n=1 Tax=Tanacetum coccineum TaxID=301880 RepID=A0ABQ5GBI4_9ASTR